MNDLSRDIHAGHHLLSIFESAKNQLDAILDQQPVCFAIVNTQGDILRANFGISTYLALPPGECTGASLAKVFQPWDWKVFLIHLSKASERPVAFELPIESQQNGKVERTTIYWRLETMRIEGRADLNLVSVLGQDISELRRAEKQLSDVLEAAPVGILTIQEDGTVSPNYSAHCQRLFETPEIGGRAAYDLIFAPGEGSYSKPELQAIKELLQAIGKPKRKFEELRTSLPTKIYYVSESNPNERKVLVPSFYAVGAGSDVTKIMLIIEDGSVQQQLQLMKEQAGFLQEEATIRILQVKKCRPELLGALLEDFDDIFKRFAAPVAAGNWATVGHNLHSIKGNARIVDFRRLAELAHEFESYLAKPSSDAFSEAGTRSEVLLNEWREFRFLIMAMNKSLSDSDGSQKAKHQLQRDGLEQIITRYRMLMNHPEIHDRIAILRLELALKTLNSIPLSEMENKLRSHVEHVCKAEKLMAELSCKWSEVRVDRNLWGILNEAFLHLLNNSIAHGLEKNRKGKFLITCTESEEQLHIEVADDGPGFNVDRINTTALQKRVVSLADSLKWSEHQIIQLIFRPGFSTLTAVDQLAGRGIGLEVVAARVAQAGGEVAAYQNQPRGTSIRMVFPLQEKVPVKHCLALSDFVALLITEFHNLKIQTGINLNFVKTIDFIDSDFVLFAASESLVVAITTIFALATTAQEAEVQLAVENDRLRLELRLLQTREFIELPPEFHVCASACYSICFNHQGEVSRRDRGLQVTFGHVLASQKMPRLKFLKDEHLDAARFLDTLGQLEQLCDRFGFELADDGADAIHSYPIWLRSSPSVGLGPGITAGASVSTLQDELLQAVGNLLG